MTTFREHTTAGHDDDPRGAARVGAGAEELPEQRLRARRRVGRGRADLAR